MAFVEPPLPNQDVDACAPENAWKRTVVFAIESRHLTRENRIDAYRDRSNRSSGYKGVAELDSNALRLKWPGMLYGRFLIPLMVVPVGIALVKFCLDEIKLGLPLNQLAPIFITLAIFFITFGLILLRSIVFNTITETILWTDLASLEVHQATATIRISARPVQSHGFLKRRPRVVAIRAFDESERANLIQEIVAHASGIPVRYLESIPE